MADTLRSIGERSFREKNVFGGRGFLIGKSTFVIIWEEGLIVKAPRSEYADLLNMGGVAPFAPGGEKPMSTWLTVSSDVVADDPELADWIRRGLAAIR